MMRTVAVLLCIFLLGSVAHAQSRSTPRSLKVFVQGDTSRLADFVESCQREFADHGLKLELVPSDGQFQYNVIIAQESSLGGAAAAVITLDRKGMFVASVVRSGRASGKGALNASAKELAKKLAVLTSQ